jgi:hypothetical protein
MQGKHGSLRRGRLSRRFASCALCVCALSVAAAEAGAATFTNPAPIAIPAAGNGPGAANPYPSIISSTTVGNVTQARVTLHGLSNTSAPDVDVLLANASGSAKALLLSDACAGQAFTGFTLTFDDAAAPVPPSGLTCAGGSYRPANYLGNDGATDTFPVVPPFVPPPPPYAASLVALNGVPAEGNWHLFINDDQAGDAGSLAGGWSLELLTDRQCAGKTATAAAMLGTQEGNVLTGTPGADVLVGLAGKDTIRGLGGNDVICGGTAGDKLFGGPGKDKLLGQGGKDNLKGQGGKDVCKGGGGSDDGSSCAKEKSL